MGDKSIQKTQYIIDVAAKVFSEMGYKNVTMKDVVDACDISRGGLYLYYESTTELFIDVMKSQFESREDFTELISDDAIGTLKTALLPLAAVITPNIPEGEVLSGMEIWCTDDLEEGIQIGYYPGLNGTDAYLIEFGFDDSAQACRQHIRTVLDLGKRPVIAHPERYACIQDDIAEAGRWTSEGCLLQINKGSPFGSYGRRAAQAAYDLLRRHLVYCVGSDAHSPYRRTPYMGEIRELLTEEFSRSTARSLLDGNPRELLGI